MEKNRLLHLPEHFIVGKIQFIREQKVLIDEDLAELYGVETKRLNEQVKRNLDRFPEDFMFQLSNEEFENLKSQFATSSWGGRRTTPYVFTEHGVLMLSSVLRSKQAVEVNIQIMRVFTRMRKLLFNHKDLLLRIEKIENKIEGQSHENKVLFEVVRKLMESNALEKNQKGRNRIGFINR
jgi:hypothetical protein